MKKQRIQYSKNNVEKVKQSWKPHRNYFKIYYKGTVAKLCDIGKR